MPKPKLIEFVLLKRDEHTKAYITAEAIRTAYEDLSKKLLGGASVPIRYADRPLIGRLTKVELVDTPMLVQINAVAEITDKDVLDNEAVLGLKLDQICRGALLGIRATAL